MEKYLKRINFNGTVIVDQLAIHNNQANRFTEWDFNDGINIHNPKQILGTHELKEITSNFFYKNPKLLNNILLFKNEKEAILNNEII